MSKKEENEEGNECACVFCLRLITTFSACTCACVFVTRQTTNQYVGRHPCLAVLTHAACRNLTIFTRFLMKACDFDHAVTHTYTDRGERVRDRAREGAREYRGGTYSVIKGEPEGTQ